MKYFVGIDESYENEKNGVFVMNFFIVKNEKDVAYINTNLFEMLAYKNKKEFKNTKISNPLRKKVFALLSKIDYINYNYTDKLENTKYVLNNYKNGLKTFAKFLTVQNTVSFYDIKIDKIGGEKFQNECIKIFHDTLKSTNIKHNVKFLDSKKSTLLQMADIFAGEIRKDINNNSIFHKFLLKNKNSIL